jgi:TRAP transporter TAXI family solute receptor
MRVVLKIYGPFALLVVLGFAVAIYFIRPAPPRTVRLATGLEGGAYVAKGNQIRTILARDGIEVEIVPSAGSVDNLRLLSAEESDVDVAFVQGGIADAASYPDLVSLGSIFVEPVWVFVRSGPKGSSVRDLTGLKMAVGASGSGTAVFAERFLSLLSPGGSAVERVYIGGDAAIEALRAGAIDAAFFVTSGHLEAFRDLLKNGEFHLVIPRHAEAFVRLNQYLTLVTLPAGVLDLREGIPAEPVTLISTVASLVAREDFHPALVQLVIEAAQEINNQGNPLTERDAFPTPHFVDLPLSEEARRFYESGAGFVDRLLPFWAANTVKRLIVLLIPIMTLLLPFFRFAPPVYRWQMRRRIFKWYKVVRRIEVQARDGSRSRPALMNELDALHAELAQLEVPLGRFEHLYHLRLHVQFVRQLIEREEAAARAASS